MGNEPEEYVKLDFYMNADFPMQDDSLAHEIQAPREAWVPFILDEPGAKPGEDDLYDGSDVASIPVTSQEAVEWIGAHRAFDSDVSQAHERLRKAEELWLAAIADWRQELQGAVAKYQPVADQIKDRQRIAEARDGLIRERRDMDIKVLKEASEAAAEAVYGPKDFVLRTMRREFSSYITGRTLHMDSCGAYRKSKGGSGEWDGEWSSPLHAYEAREHIQKGAVPVKLCQRCKVAEKLTRAEQIWAKG